MARDSDDGRENFEPMNDPTSNNGAKHRKIEALLARAELESAHRLAEELYHEDPEDLERVRLLVKVLYRQNRQDKATAYLNRANLVEVESHTMFDNLSRDSIVLDIGGWKGNFTDYVLQRYGSEVHMVEPNIKFYEMGKARFGGEDRVHAYDCAIGGETKRVRFHPPPSDYPGQEKGSSLLANSPYVDSSVYYEVQEYSLHDFVQLAELERIDLIKMDMEGAEFEVLLDPIRSRS